MDEQMFQNQQAQTNQIVTPDPIQQQTTSEPPSNPKPSFIPKKYFIIIIALILLLGIAYAGVYVLLNKQLSTITHTKP